MVRFKNRYLLCSFVFPASLDNPFHPVTLPNDSSSTDGSSALPTPPNLSEGGLISLLRESLSVNFGDVGAGEVGGAFSIKYLSPTTHLMILRVAREHLRTIWAALTLLRRVGGTEVLVRVLHISGTIRKIQHSAMAHDRAAILGSVQKRRRSAASASKPPLSAIAAGIPPVVTTREEEEALAQIDKNEKVIMALEA